MKKWLCWMSMLVVLSVILSSCSLLTQENQEQEVSQASELGKFNAYVDLGNYITGWLDMDVYGYTENFGWEEEMTFKNNFDIQKFEGMVLTPIIEGAFDIVDTVLEYTSKDPFFGAADETMKELAPRLTEFLHTINEVDTYYRSKAFAEDDFKKGKELHHKLHTQYDTYIDLYDRFSIEFKVITNKRVQEDLEMMKKNDYLASYYANSIVVRSKEIQEDFYLADITEENLLDYEVAKYKEKYDLLTEDMNQFLEYSKDKERLKKEGIQTLWGFDEALAKVKGSATSILQALEAQSMDISEGSSGKVTTHDRIGFLEYYDTQVSQLISSYNNMIK